jgi:hypothetical protein
MNEPLDSLLRRIAARDHASELTGLEATVLHRIGAARQSARTRAALVPFQVATVILSLALGIASGLWLDGSHPVPKQPPGLFDSVARLAPSSLLEGRE